MTRSGMYIGPDRIAVLSDLLSTVPPGVATRSLSDDSAALYRLGVRPVILANAREKYDGSLNPELKQASVTDMLGFFKKVHAFSMRTPSKYSWKVTPNCSLNARLN